MSINIDKEDLREAIDLYEIAKAFPLWYSEESAITYDGEYLIVTGAAGFQYAIGTGFGSPPYGSGKSFRPLIVQATVKAVSTDTDCYFFFLEPKKGDYAEFQGFKTDAGAGTHKFEFRSGGTEEEDAIAGQDWTADTLFKIRHIHGMFDHNSGITGAIATGTAVSHGLLNNGAGLTPTSVIAMPTVTGLTNIYVDTVGAATFNINFAGGGNQVFYWEADYEQTPVCEGYIAGALKAQCNDHADISMQPFSIYCCQPNSISRVMTLKYPPGIHSGN